MGKELQLRLDHNIFNYHGVESVSVGDELVVGNVEITG